MLAGRTVARVSSAVKGCTINSHDYPIDLGEDSPFMIHDTAGLNEASKDGGVVPHEKAVNDLFNLLCKLGGNPQSPDGGLHLLLFCVKGGRQLSPGSTGSSFQHYRENWLLFSRFIAQSKVPGILVITYSESEDGDMMGWWRRYRDFFDRAGILPQEAVCVTSLRNADQDKHIISRKRLTRAILRHSLEPENSFKFDHIKEGFWEGLGRFFVGWLRFCAFQESKSAQDMLDELGVNVGKEGDGGMTRDLIVKIAKKMDEKKLYFTA